MDDIDSSYRTAKGAPGNVVELIGFASGGLVLLVILVLVGFNHFFPIKI